MPDSADQWYLRLPDGRVVRTEAAALRQQIAAGRLTHDVQARRTNGEAWRPLEAIDEFSDLRKGGVSMASRLDPAAMRFVGVRALLEEMVAALDSTLSARKLALALVGGLAMGALLVPVAMGLLLPWLAYAGIAVVALGQIGLLSRMTFQELSRLKPVRVAESVPGLTGLVLMLVFSLGWPIAGLIAARVAMPLLLPTLPPEWPGALLIEIATLAVMLLLGAVLVYFTPLAAVLVVEESGLFAGLGGWRRVAHGRMTTVFVSQWMVLAIALVLAGPVGLLAWASPSAAWVAMVQGFVVSIVVTYLAVANVFLYLHFRYAGR